MSLNIICKNIEKTYDINIISTLENKNILDQFKSVIKDVFENPNIGGNRTLITLIYNYFYKKIPNLRYISGPSCLSYLRSSTYNKQIYLFYEAHGRVNNCNDKFLGPNIDINKYLNKLFSTTDKFIDFYVETSKTITSKKFKYNTTNYIDKVRAEFYNCVDPNFQCEWNNIRVHYADIRSVIKFEDGKQSLEHYNSILKIGDLISLLEYSFINYINEPSLYYNKDFFDTKEEYDIHLNEIKMKMVHISNNCIDRYNEILLYKKELLEYIFLFLSPSIITKLYGNAKNIDIIKKEIQKSNLSSLTIFMLFKNSYTNNPTLKNLIKYNKKNAKTISKQLMNITKIEHVDIKDINIEEPFQNISNIVEMLNGLKLLVSINNTYILPHMACYMDLYTICRMFKTFKHDSKIVYQPVNISNVIFYGGESHSKNIAIMLKYLGFEELYTIGQYSTMVDNTSPRCLDMKSKKLDFAK